MIELITGLPGNGKTLYTIGEVKKRAELEGRPVYCAGLKELALDWQVIDPLKWMDVPAGSIIVIDECQKVFRNRSLGSTPPVHVTELEEHRHKGLDFYLITQHPSLIDPAIRRLTQVHKHIIRIFGMEASTIHKWQSCIANPDLPSSRRDSEKVRWGFDKSLYGLYKSAEVHTMRRSIPLRLKLLLLLPLLLFLAGWGVYRMTLGKHQPAAPASSASSAMPVSVAGVAPGGKGEVERFDPVRDAEHYVHMNTPRVDGLAYTAPKYDEITKPSTAPVPAMCIQHRDTCKCFSQQATPLDVKYTMCLEFARNGFFREFDPDKDRRDTERTAQSVKVLEGRSFVDSERSQPGSQVIVFTNPPRDPPHQPAVAGIGSKGG